MLLSIPIKVFSKEHRTASRVLLFCGNHGIETNQKWYETKDSFILNGIREWLNGKVFSAQFNHPLHFLLFSDSLQHFIYLFQCKISREY